MQKSKPKIAAIIQARMGSERMPGKVLMDIEGKPILWHVVERAKSAKTLDDIIIATTTNAKDDAIEKLAKKEAWLFFRGPEEDVLGRYYQAAKKFNIDVIVRITSDCPLIDPEIVDKAVDTFLNFKGDYVANVLGERTFPRGLDVEVFSSAILEKIWKDVEGKKDRENVTSFIRKNPKLFKCKRVVNPRDYSFYRWTVDEKDDYKLIKIIYQELYKKNPNFRMKNILELFEKKPELIKINQHVKQKNKYS